LALKASDISPGVGGGGRREEEGGGRRRRRRREERYHLLQLASPLNIPRRNHSLRRFSH